MSLWVHLCALWPHSEADDSERLPRQVVHQCLLLSAGPPSSSGGPFLYEPVEVRARRSTAGGSTPQPGSPGGRSEGSMRSARSVRSGARDGGGRPRPPHERLYGHAREIALKQERRRQARFAQFACA